MFFQECFVGPVNHIMLNLSLYMYSDKFNIIDSPLFFPIEKSEYFGTGLFQRC